MVSKLIKLVHFNGNTTNSTAYYSPTNISDIHEADTFYEKLSNITM